MSTSRFHDTDMVMCMAGLLGRETRFGIRHVRWVKNRGGCKIVAIQVTLLQLEAQKINSSGLQLRKTGMKGV